MSLPLSLPELGAVWLTSTFLEGEREREELPLLCQELLESTQAAGVSTTSRLRSGAADPSVDGSDRASRLGVKASVGVRSASSRRTLLEAALARAREDLHIGGLLRRAKTTTPA